MKLGVSNYSSSRRQYPDFQQLGVCVGDQDKA